MEAIVPLVAIFMVFGTPVAITWLVMHYRDRRRREEQAPGAAAVNNAQLLAVAERMERRIEALEQILDAEAPGWRKRHHEHA